MAHYSAQLTEIDQEARLLYSLKIPLKTRKTAQKSQEETQFYVSAVFESFDYDVVKIRFGIY